jgi:hypothetical protein
MHLNTKFSMWLKIMFISSIFNLSTTHTIIILHLGIHWVDIAHVSMHKFIACTFRVHVFCMVHVHKILPCICKMVKIYGRVP